MSKYFTGHSRYFLILIAVLAAAEYVVMMLFDITGLEPSLPQEVEAVADSFLLLSLSAAPVYFWIVKPLMKTSQDYQDELENLVAALEGAGDAVLITDAAGVITFVNRAFTEVTGFSANEAIDNNPSMLQSGKQSKAFYKMMWRSLKSVGEWKGEIWNKRKNGELYPESLHIKAVKDSDGVVKGYVGVFSDITEKRRQQEVLKQSQKLEAIGTLVGGVAHNFNNMLAGITGHAYLAKNSSDQSKSIHHLQGIEHITNDAGLIVRQLLTFAHEGVQQKKNTPIVHLLKEATKTARLGISEDIEFFTDFTNESLMVYCDPVEIQQVLINLINNARDALNSTQPRRISVTVERKPWAGCSRNYDCFVCSEDVVHLVVEDSGSGISDADMAHIFDPFFTTKGVGEGTGLGLSMAKGAVGSHGGSMHVSSTVGSGSTFEVCLPIVNKPPPELEEETQRVVLARSKETLLVIDDDEIVRNTLSQVLQSLGYSVLLAENGAEGVRVFQAHAKQISLIVTDIVMPEMDGYMAIEEIQKIKADLPVVFITGYANDKLKNGTYRKHMEAMISKPFNIAELSCEVHRLLNPDKL